MDEIGDFYGCGHASMPGARTAGLCPRCLIKLALSPAARATIEDRVSPAEGPEKAVLDDDSERDDRRRRRPH